jgi:hypothetical protein
VTDLDSPPSHPVEWNVQGPFRQSTTYLDIRLADSINVTATTAWAAHVLASPRLVGSPTFGSCVVTRVEVKL